MVREMMARVWWLDICVWMVLEEGERVKMKVSTIWVPWVLIMRIVWPALRGVAMPWAAGIVVRGIL